MADPVLHIKDSYYFEVPKLLYPYDYKSARQFPDVWVSLDPQFQEWEFDRLYHDLTPPVADSGLPPKDQAKEDWHHWAHADHANFAKPFDVFLEEKYQAHVAKFDDWKTAQIAEARAKNDGSVDLAKRLQFSDYTEHLKSAPPADHSYLEFLSWRHKNETAFERAKTEAGGKEAIHTWKDAVAKQEIADWSKEKITAYNQHLSGKILIPQPFATLRNLYEKESGFAISKYLIIEVFVGLVLLVLFSQLARRIEHGRLPKGKFWNLLEVFLVFIRDQIARPVLGSHHEENHGHPEHGHSHDEHGQLHSERTAHAAAAHGHDHHADPASRFVPLLWTIFFFVLGCNLMGMVPWAGTPSAAFAVTFAFACVTFICVLLFGMLQFGIGGFFLNQMPSMDLPWYMAIIIKPMILIIELLGLVIKHSVLSVRLFANMVAGHLVLLGIMGFAFGADAALKFTAPGAAGWQWAVTAAVAVVASATFSLLELFVAFLQAYIFTFLSALFIGAAIHKH
jgi:F-type H+-transporting ATPase subunit a